MKKAFRWDNDNKIDFKTIEKKLGFIINNELKEFYNSNLFEDITLNLDKKYLSISIKHGNWFKEVENIKVTIIGNKDLSNFENAIINNFNQETIYGEEKDVVRYILGYITEERGEMGLYFNNVTGQIEWCDYEWGADTWNENPRGVISSSIKEFIELIEK